MIAAGAALLLVGALWEIVIYIRGAWPTAVTWILMTLGILMVAVGTSRRRPQAAFVVWSIFGAFVLGILLLWLSG